jgi:hypothetical protein
MPASPEPTTPEDIETSADQATAACGGDAREAVKALIVANSFLVAQITEPRAGSVDGIFTRRYEFPWIGSIDPRQIKQKMAGRPPGPTCKHEPM